jgi:hypothetical protein
LERLARINRHATSRETASGAANSWSAHAAAT